MHKHEQETVGPCGSYSLRSSRGRVFIFWRWLPEHRSDLSVSCPGSHPRSDAFTQDEHAARRRCQASITEDGVIARTPGGGSSPRSRHPHTARAGLPARGLRIRGRGGPANPSQRQERPLAQRSGPRRAPASRGPRRAGRGQAGERLGAIWSDDFDAYASGELDASKVHCALCMCAPCRCPPFGTPEYFKLLNWRHGRTSTEENPRNDNRTHRHRPHLPRATPTPATGTAGRTAAAA